MTLPNTMNSKPSTTTSGMIDSKDLANMSLDELMDIDINQVEAVKDFIPFPTGSYRFEVTSVGFDEVGAEDKPVITVEWNILEVVELVDASQADEVGEVPRVQKENYFLTGGKTGYGVRAFLTAFREIGVRNGCTKLPEIMEAAIGATGEALIERKTRRNKDTGENHTNSSISATMVTFD